MADNMKIGASLALDGEAEFKRAVSDINTNIRVLGSEMGKVTAQFSDNADSIEALNAKQDVLNRKLSTQQQQVETLRAALQNSSEQYGEADKRTANWQISLNKAEAELAKTQSELGKTTEQINHYGSEANSSGDKVEKAGKQAKQSGDDASSGDSGWSKLGKSLSSVGEVAGKALLALGTAAVGAATAIGGMTLKAAQSADDINTLSTQTGLSTESIQKFQYATELIDVSMETLEKGLSKTTKAVGAAVKSHQDYIEVADGVKVAIRDNNGQLLSSEDVFYSTIDALGQMTNETERDIATQQIFGKSFQEMNPLIKGGSQALKEYGDQAQAAGLILGQDSLNNLNKLQDAVDTFKATLTGSGSLFATAFAGPISEGINTITGYMKELSAAFSKGGFSALSDKFGAILSDMVNKTGEYLPKIIEFGTQVIQKLIEGISQNVGPLTQGAIEIVDTLLNSLLDMLPQLIDMGAKILVEISTGIAESLPELVPTIVKVVMQIIQTIIDNLPKLLEAGLKIIEGLVQGILAAIPKIIEALPQIIMGIVNFIIGAIPQLIQAGIQLLTALIGALPQIIEAIVNALPQIIDGIINGLLSAIPQIIDAGIKLLLALIEDLPQIIETIVNNLPRIITGIVDGLISNIPKIIEAGIQLFVAIISNIPEIIKQIVLHLPEIIIGIVKGIADLAVMMWDAGKALVQGLWEGISKAGSWLWEQVTGWINGLVSGIKGLLGIHSPSTVFMGIGENMGLGLGAGFTSAMNSVAQDMQNAIPTDFSMRGTYQTEGLVNGLASVFGLGSSTQTINIVLPDGKMLASVVYDPLTQIIRQKGAALA